VAKKPKHSKKKTTKKVTEKKAASMAKKKVVAKSAAKPTKSALKAKPAPAKKPAAAQVSTADMAEAASELIALEQQLVAGRNDQKLFDRWITLVKQVLGGEGHLHSRRSVRLPAHVPVRLGIRQGEFLCHLTDLSQLGLTVAGPVFSHIAVGEPIEVRSIEEAGKVRNVGVRCDVVRIDSGQTPAVAGLRVANDNDDASSQRFFDVIYYPMYLAYLRRAAEGAN
jgi:hypothetical protein